MIVAIAIVLVSAAPAASKRHRAGHAPVSAVSIALEIVEDPHFPPISAASLERVLGTATETFGKKFGRPHIRFERSGQGAHPQTPAMFFSRLPQDDFRACLARFETRRALRTQDFDRPRLQESVASFLSRWRMPALLPAFPPELRVTVRTHEDAARALVAEMRQAASVAFEATFSSGEPVLASRLTDNNLGRRFVDWLCAFEVQSSADVVLTNAYVFYDLLTEPYPHAVYHGSRLAGAVMQSPTRELFVGRAVFVSSFGTSGEPVALLEPRANTLSPEERDAFVGRYLLAHELGHALLRIPDVYDHPPRCLMTTDYALGYLDGYERLQASPGRCPRCSLYVDARRTFDDFEAALRSGRLRQAEKLVERVIARVPTNIDGSVGEFAARVYTRLGMAELDGQRPRKAELYARRALSADPLHAPARMLLRRVAQQTTLPASR